MCSRLLVVLDKTKDSVINHIIDKVGQPKGITNIEGNTSVLTYADDTVIVDLDIIERKIVGSRSNLSVSLTIIVNGTIAAHENFEGSDVIVLKNCGNIRYRLDMLLGGKLDGLSRRNTQEKALV